MQGIFLQRVGNAKMGLKMVTRSLSFRNDQSVRVIREEFRTMMSFTRTKALSLLLEQESKYISITIQDSINAGGTWLTRCGSKLWLMVLLSWIRLLQNDGNGYLDIQPAKSQSPLPHNFFTDTFATYA